MPRIPSLAVVAIITLCTSARAAVPPSLSYQAFLTEADGSPVNSGVVVEFSIHNVESGGTPLYTDTQLVVPDQGLFSVELGRLLLASEAQRRLQRSQHHG